MRSKVQTQLLKLEGMLRSNTERSYFSTDLQQHIGHLPTQGVPLSVSYYFAFSYCSWGSQSKNTEVVCHSLVQWTTLCQTSPPCPPILGGPTWHGLVSLSQTRLWSQCDQIDQFSVTMVSVCLPSDALLQHLPCYLGFSYLGHGLSLHGCSSKAHPLVLTVDESLLLTSNVEQLFLALLRPCSRCSLDVGLLLSAATPDLGHGVAPLGRSCAVTVWHSQGLNNQQ